MKDVYWVVEANGKEIGAMTLDEFEDIHKSVKANWMNRIVAVIRFSFSLHIRKQACTGLKLKRK
jgi:hypothetical protein